MDRKMKRTGVFTEIKQAAEEISPDLTAWRRDFHRYAETGFQEMRTASLIARKLKDLGYEVLTGEEVLEKSVLMALPDEETCREAYERAKKEGADPEYLERMKDGLTGVIGILRCGEGPVVALRFDIDALPIPESDSPEHLPAREGFASIHPGCMHACGHDGHAAIGLGTATLLARLKDQIHGTVKLLFQPAEEGVGGGAKGMAAKGHLDDVMYMIGAHVTTTEGHETGRLYPGNHGALATTKWEVRFTGKSAHAGAYPHLGKDALLAACCAVLNLNAIPRHGKGATRIGVGRFFDESAINSISDDVRFSFEVRGATNELREYMLEKARRVIEAAAQMYDCAVTFEQLGEAGSFSSSPAMMQRIRRVCEQDLHLEVTRSDSMRSEGSEDVSFLIEKTQENGGEASFMRLLTAVQGYAHGRTYDFDEELLADGVKVFAGVVYDICAF